MAYQNFSEIAGGPVQVVEAPIASLSALEWSVVAIAQHDGLSSLGEPGRLAIALGTIFGGKRPNPRLADPKLEVLRRVAVLAWHRGYAISTHELRAFLEAGFTLAQYDTLQRSIGIGREALNRKRAA